MKWALGFIGAIAFAAASSFAAEQPGYALLAVKIGVKDQQKTIDFYTRLGMKVGRKYNAAEQELKWDNASSGPTIVLVHDETGRIKTVPGGSFFLFSVTDMKATVAKLKEVGAEFGEPMGDGKNYVIQMTSDPDGNRIELVQPLASMQKQ